jgi:hypothetical protein
MVESFYYMPIITRDLAPVLSRWATLYPVVTLTGPRQSGKTTLCKTVFPGKPYLSLELSRSASDPPLPRRPFRELGGVRTPQTEAPPRASAQRPPFPGSRWAGSGHAASRRACRPVGGSQIGADHGQQLSRAPPGGQGDPGAGTAIQHVGLRPGLWWRSTPVATRGAGASLEPDRRTGAGPGRLNGVQTPKLSGSLSKVTGPPASSGAWRMASPSSWRPAAFRISCMR